MILMPDTNVWIKLLNPESDPVKDRFIVTGPVMFGTWYAYRTKRYHDRCNRDC